MFKHNLLLIYRNTKRFKTTFFINLIGLSSGVACTLLIYLWVADELKIDRFKEKNDRIFQVLEHVNQADGIKTSQSTSGPLAESLNAELPTVEFATTTRGPVDNVISFKDNNIRATGQYASKDFFNVFPYRLIEGDPNNVLADRNRIVISEDLARRLFNTNESVLSRSVEFQHDKEFFVSGVFETVPSNFSQQFDFLMSFDLFVDANPFVLEWRNTPISTFLVLHAGTNVDQFNREIAEFVKVKTNGEVTHRTPFIKQYSEKYLHGRYENGIQVGGRIEYVRLFSIIAVFILLIACVNFMNLSTANASRRIKEVGIKKAIGGSRKTLIFQHLGESMVMVFLSLIVAVILVFVLLPQFNIVTGKELTLDLNLTLFGSIIGIALITGLLAGSYPAFYLSGFKPAVVLKGKLHDSIGEIFARKGLVAFQFVLSIILIVSVLVVYKQIEYVQTKELGYEKDDILLLNREGALLKRRPMETFLSDVKNVPGVVNASSITHNMTGHAWGVYGLDWEGKDPDDKTEFENIIVNYDMMETLGIEMKDGRMFSKNFSADSTKIIFNEAAIAFMGLQDPVGKQIMFWGNEMQIIGVAKNFHFESLHETVKPLLFRLQPQNTNKIMIKIQAGTEKETIANLDAFYRKYNPGFPLDYKFLDENYQAQYEAEKRVSVLSRYFASLAIVISCLGLFGLSAFTAERRLKEIGIRKALGSTVMGIIYLLTSEFTRIVFVSILIALPLSYLIAKRWLENFAFSISLKWWYFVGAGIVAFVIAILTVTSQAVKAAKVNPVKCLKDE